MSTTPAPKPRAYVYIDGFNLFYRAVRGTPYAWLNLEALCDQILPQYNVLKVKYYTAKVRSRRDPEKSLRQETYLRALRTLPRVEICFGTYSSHKVMRELAKGSLWKKLREFLGLNSGMNKLVKVYDPKEKGSDVNLAVHMVNDGWKNLYDVAALISNDTDLQEAVKIVRNDCGKLVGVINPSQAPNPDLHKEANFVRQIRQVQLASSQLPNTIAGTRISKPVKW